MSESVADEGGGGIGDRLRDLERIARNGGAFGFHFRLVSAGVFDSNKLDVFHLGVFPLKSDSPRGFAGIGINGVSGTAFELVIMEKGHEQEGFFIGFVEDGEAKYPFLFERLS